MQGNINSMYFNFASASFYHHSRYDNIQVSNSDGSKFFCRLLAIFSFIDLLGRGHNLAFVQHVIVVHEYDELYKHLLVELDNSYDIIPLEAVDNMVDFKPRRTQKNQYYIHPIVEEY